MDVRPAGASPPGIDLVRAVPAAAVSATLKTAGLASAGAAMDVSALRELSEPDLARLLGIVEPALSPQDSARVDSLLHNAIAAAAEGDVARALDRLTAVITLDPARADSLRSTPGLENIRVEVDQLVSRMQTVARLDAEGRLGQAAKFLDTAGPRKLADWDASPAALLAMAGGLFDAGGHVQYVQASAVAQALIDPSHWGPAEAPTLVMPRTDPLPEKPPGLGVERFRALWRRAPLLILLLAWLVLGLAGGSAAFLLRRFWPENVNAALIEAGFDLWGLGFLGLVLFGFYMRVRDMIKKH